ncbi:MAG: MlaD family protein [Rhodospirillales bacterium]|jgi:phospholipid/cholesterol/gamma-HCH transport system substrate-binding protein|nr:MlaD family protein [Rhodospirillales bacterium]
MGKHAIETVMGAVVLMVAGVFVYFAYSMAGVKAVQGYQVTALFYKIGGLKTGSDVRVNGIKVGNVIELGLDSETYDAVVTVSIAGHLQLPVDTVASIASAGLMGGKYVRLEPGKEKKFIAADGRFAKTKDFRSLEDQVGEIIFLATGGPK